MGKELMIREVKKDGTVIGKRGHPLKSFINNSGYEMLTFYRVGKSPKKVQKHRVIWEYFNGAIPEGLTVDHIDGNKLNNCLNNLQLMSAKENCIKSKAKFWEFTSPAGDRVEIFNLNEFCRNMGLDMANMSRVHKLKQKQHKGWSK